MNNTTTENRIRVDLEMVEVLSVSDTEWRIRDASQPPSDVTSLLGFVSVIGETYEVMYMGQPRMRRYFANFDDALSDLLRARLHAPPTTTWRGDIHEGNGLSRAV